MLGGIAPGLDWADSVSLCSGPIGLPHRGLALPLTPASSAAVSHRGLRTTHTLPGSKEHKSLFLRTHGTPCQLDWSCLEIEVDMPLLHGGFGLVGPIGRARKAALRSRGTVGPAPPRPARWGIAVPRILAALKARRLIPDAAGKKL